MVSGCPPLDWGGVWEEGSLIPGMVFNSGVRRDGLRTLRCEDTSNERVKILCIDV